MINYWWVTRPKRKLNSIPEVLSTFAEISLNQEWQGQRNTHLNLEEALEEAGLKRIGERRDQTGGGARTYQAWVASLGLIFTQESTNQLKLTLAGEAIMNGDSPVAVLKNQILKYQFPSSFSTSRGVDVSSRFKIRPFRFLLRLLMDPAVAYLSEEEIAKVIITNAENETEDCYRKTVDKLINFRNYGEASLEADFFTKYAPKTGVVNPDHPYSHLTDTANTLINWLEYTQLAKRDEDDRKLRIIPEKAEEIRQILSVTPPFIDRPRQHEYFQRKYGIDPKHQKDTRNLAQTQTITAKVIAEQKVKQAFVAESLKTPITKISTGLVDKIVSQTGLEPRFVEEALLRLYPHGAIGSFMTEYFEMAFKGRDEATEFEKATVQLFCDVFGFETRHVGPIGLTPDVLLLSDSEGYAGIIDNKAYSKYKRGNLFFEITRIIDAKRPKVVFLENVPNLMEHDNGRTFLVIFNSLAQFGYTVYYKVMPANEYGNLPQIRKRIYITAIHESVNGSYKHPEPLELTLKSVDIIHRHERQNEIYYYNGSALFSYFESYMKDKKAIYRPTDTEVRMTKNQMCPTLTANMGTYPNRVPVVWDDYGIRKLTLRECLDFQGFPKDYYFPNTITIDDAYKQCGNTVCIPIIKRIAERINIYVAK